MMRWEEDALGPVELGEEGQIRLSQSQKVAQLLFRAVLLGATFTAFPILTPL